MQALQPLLLQAESVRGRSPLTHLYNHALESIFAWLSLTELAVVMATCRRWRHIVGGTMKRIDASFVVDLCALGTQAITLPLSRHVTIVTTRELFGPDHRTLFELFPHLQSFFGHMLIRVQDVLSSLQFRPSLTRVTIYLVVHPMVRDTPSTVANAVVTVLATLPLLRYIAIRVARCDEFSLAPLQTMTQLESLTVLWDCKNRYDVDWLIQPITFARRFLDEVRALAWLSTVFISQLSQDADALAYVFRIPHSLHWKDCTFESSHRLPVIHAMQSLRHSLTTMHLNDVVDATWINPSVTKSIPSNQLAASFRGMSQLTTLVLSDSQIPSVDMTRLLQSDTFCLLDLSLTKVGSWDSFDCFTTGPLTRTLKMLALVQCLDIPTVEIPKLAALRAVHTLVVIGMFRADDVRALHTPSLVMPALLRFMWV